MPPTAPCDGCCVKIVQFIGTHHYQVIWIFETIIDMITIIASKGLQYHCIIPKKGLQYHCIIPKLIPDQAHLHWFLRSELLHGQPCLYDWGGCKKILWIFFGVFYIVVLYQYWLTKFEGSLFSDQFSEYLHKYFITECNLQIYKCFHRGIFVLCWRIVKCPEKIFPPRVIGTVTCAFVKRTNATLPLKLGQRQVSPSPPSLSLSSADNSCSSAQPGLLGWNETSSFFQKC